MFQECSIKIYLFLEYGSAYRLLSKKEHYMKIFDVHALVDSVKKAWDGGCVDKAIGKIWNRLSNILVLVKKGNGGN